MQKYIGVLSCDCLSDYEYAKTTILNECDIIVENKIRCLFTFSDNIKIHNQIKELKGYFGYMTANLSDVEEILMNVYQHLKLVRIGRNKKEYEYCLNTEYTKYSTLAKEIAEASFYSFYIVFQPKYCLGKADYEGCEVLCRWEHTVGKLNPLEFLPVIKSFGAGIHFDCFVFEEVCKIIHKMSSVHKMHRYAINMTIETIESDGITERLLGLSKKWSVDPTCIIIEIIEDSEVSRYNQVSKSLLSLREAGFSIALDDFGTGYSSYYRLGNLYFDEIKIPRQFLKIESEELRDKIIVHIVELAKMLSCRTVFEGVETEQEAIFAKSLAVDYIQGYYYARPMQVSEFIDFLQ